MNLYLDYPWILWGLLIIVPFIGFDFFSLFRQRNEMPPVLWKRFLFSTLFFSLFLVFFMTALAGPRWGIGSVSSDFRGGLDIVIALDISGSMDICDIQDNDNGEVSRLERGLSLAKKTVAVLPDLRYAAAAGGNRSILAVPLTWDNDTVLNFLEAAGPEIITGRGTNLESLLDTASGAFGDSFPFKRLILLFSDGEALTGSFTAAVDRLNQNNVSVAALALGSDAGRPVPGMQNTISRRDTQAMRITAEKTGGIYIDGNRDDAMAVLVDYLRQIIPQMKTGAGSTEKKPRWFLFLVAAIICFGLSKLGLLKK